MKSLLISVLCLTIVVGICVVYDNYSESEIASYRNIIEDKILPAVEQEDWDKAIEEFEAMESKWDSYREKASFFYNTNRINDIAFTLVRTKGYIKASDVSNSSGELQCLSTQMDLLQKNESFIKENIF
ncbi:MAG: DUF4363 family protein [Eubacteriales bacterium]|nr:DUF4363 family protein [Eubacteriales bacterium]MDD4389253.1 DUF4363 family protein [Eubacteriales bacterium]